MFLMSGHHLKQEDNIGRSIAVARIENLCFIAG